MNEEEEKAIKTIEEFRDYYAREDIHKEDFNNNQSYEKALSEIRQLRNNFDKVLNLIIKLQKENEELNNRCRNLDKEAQAYLEELAGDNTLTRRTIKQLQEENEELKEERQIVGIPVRNKRDRRIGIVLHQWESGSVAVLESINPRVINTHDSWNTLEIVTDEVKQTQTKCETIPVSLVKDKIEHYQKLQHNYIEKYDEINEGLQAMISALKELLGKE